METNSTQSTADATSKRVRVAFATSDKLTINEHFGRSTQFIVYDISQNDVHQVDLLHFSDQPVPDKLNHAERHVEKMKGLSPCHIVYSAAIGNPVAAELIRLKVFPVVKRDNPAIEDVLQEVQKLLNGNMPIWLKRIVSEEEYEPFSDGNPCDCS